jgi:ADP-heptose:LPS heptosyltransferase
MRHLPRSATPSRLKNLLHYLPIFPPAVLARRLLRQARVLRDGRQFLAAALLCQEAARLLPRRAAIHIQCGHMFKEAGDMTEAEAHYSQAAELTPHSPELALQLGHFYKLAGRPEASAAAYRRAAALKPGWSEPRRELAAYRRAGFLQDGAADAPAEGLVPELLPTSVPETGPSLALTEDLRIHRLGAVRERSNWGMMSTLRGLEAIRGACVSPSPIDELHILLNGVLFHKEGLRPCVQEATLRKFVFNAWVDVSAVAPGLHEIGLVLRGGGQEVRRVVRQVVVGHPIAEADAPGSDSVVVIDPADPRPPAAQVRGRRSVARPARRSLLPHPPRAILVQRIDQLGDLVTAAPALHRLRALFPGARLVGLLSAANAELARSFGVFDDIVLADFLPPDRDGRRAMTAAAQRALGARLAPFGFDVAIDLAQAAGSQPLLLLSGARLLFGFHDHEYPFLTGGFEASTRDPRNGGEMAAQSTKQVALVERVAASLVAGSAIIRRGDLSRAMLAPYGLGDGGAYAILHAGARAVFNRWPHYPALAARFLAETELRIVLMADDQALRARLPASPRLLVIDQRIPFDDFDALLSFCAVFIGNDSGPKHLASLRGAPVISLHAARLNWNEWGQEATGTIISRRVPCAGCGITVAEDCGQGFTCLVDIAPDEVFEEALRLLKDAVPTSAAG